MPVTGKGRRGILVVAEAPGRDEDKRNTQLIGKSGQFLRGILRGLDVSLDGDCWKTNALICYPQNKKPDSKRVLCCRPNLLRTIKELKPKVIILLGGVAVESLIGNLWKEKPGGITRWAGWRIPSQELNAWVCPTYHPSYLLRENNEVLSFWFGEHLRQAFDLSKRPWKTLPDYSSKVEVILDPARAATAVNEIRTHGFPIAFDYETTHLKPDASDAEIWSCAISNGKRTIACPWVGEAVKAVHGILRSKLKKIAANMKFEQRWTKKEFGHGVKNWAWDTMIAAHALDNRKGITSVSFQSFVRLGQGDYDSHIKSYLQSTKPGQANRIKEVSLNEVLLYNGMDAILEYKIMERQTKQMGVEL